MEIDIESGARVDYETLYHRESRHWVQENDKLRAEIEELKRRLERLQVECNDLRVVQSQAWRYEDDFYDQATTLLDAHLDAWLHDIEMRSHGGH